MREREEGMRMEKTTRMIKECERKEKGMAEE